MCLCMVLLLPQGTSHYRLKVKGQEVRKKDEQMVSGEVKGGNG